MAAVAPPGITRACSLGRPSRSSLPSSVALLSRLGRLAPPDTVRCERTAVARPTACVDPHPSATRNGRAVGPLARLGDPGAAEVADQADAAAVHEGGDGPHQLGFRVSEP